LSTTQEQRPGVAKRKTGISKMNIHDTEIFHLLPWQQR